MQRREQSTERPRRTYRVRGSGEEGAWGQPPNAIHLDELPPLPGIEIARIMAAIEPRVDRPQPGRIPWVLRGWGLVITLSLIALTIFAFACFPFAVARSVDSGTSESQSSNPVTFLDDQTQTMTQSLTNSPMSAEPSTTESTKSKVTNFSPVPGFYIMPAMEIKQDWMQPQHPLPVSAKPTTDTKTLDDTWSLHPRSEDDSSTLNGSHDMETVRMNEPGGEEVSMVHQMPRRGLHMYTHWCVQNVCSTGKRLAAMCNDTALRIKNITINRDKAQQQECAWCWDLSSTEAKRNATQKALIRTHCERVSNRAAFWVIGLCGVLVTLVIMAIFGCIQRAHDRRRTKQKSRTAEEILLSRNTPPSNEKVPGNRAAPAA